MTEQSNLKIFISHSSEDSDLAKAVINLIRSALGISAEKIRCTSVNGYKLRVGANTEEHLRKEIFETDILIALITQDSYKSTFAMFEMGARWGAKRPILPLLGPEIEPSSLTPPLSNIHALKSNDRQELHQFLSDLENYLEYEKNDPQVYTNEIDKIINYDNSEVYSDKISSNSLSYSRIYEIAKRVLYSN